ncbi:MAG: pantoate--beta-alanine ligase [Acidobacteriota bacterium]
MKIARTVGEIRELLRPLRANTRIGLVPTMGAFHGGHVALFQTARAECGAVVASLFVNPSQFGDPADLAAYPRDEARDARIAEQSGIDMLFAPTVDEMFPEGYTTWIESAGAARGLESDHRPGHFRGVATVCVKLFTIAGPQVAFFGQKDAQQIAVVKQVVRDLNLDLDIRVVPTVRDVDGLALSSRNTRLSPGDRERARAIPRAIEAGLAAHRSGGDPVAAAREALGDLVPDYVTVAGFADAPTLVIAARVGGTRLIDNAPLDRR